MARKFIEALKCAPPGQAARLLRVVLPLRGRRAHPERRIASLGGVPGAAEKNNLVRSFIIARLRYG
jgi:hypothetical protein